MNSEYILQNLEKIAEILDIKIQYDEFKKDDFKTKSSLCTVKGDNIIIIDKSLKIKDKIEIIIQELSQYDLENVYMPPKIRELFSGIKEGEDSYAG